MRILFSKAQWQTLEIEMVERPQPAPAYLDERELLWEKKSERCARLGQTLWNGEIYTIEDILPLNEAKVRMRWAICEYKDVVVRMEKGVADIAERHGWTAVPRFITVDFLPVTSDGKFVYGLRSGTTAVKAGALGLIGGTLNRDEMAVNGIADLEVFMRKEIEEETQLSAQTLPLEFFSLNYFRGKYEFLYTCRLEVSAANIGLVHRPGEFEKLLALTEAEACSGAYAETDAFRYSWNYLRELNA